MPAIVDAAAQWLRDFQTDGVPSSGINEPVKGEGIAVFGTVESAIDVLIEVVALDDMIKFQSVAEMNADLAHVAGTYAVIFSDDADTLEVYRKTGGSGSGSWVFKTTLAQGSNTAAIAVLDGRLDTAEADIVALEGRTITAAGLATGGGNLTADRVITVAVASAAEALSATLNTKAVTPLALAPYKTKDNELAAAITNEHDDWVASHAAQDVDIDTERSNRQADVAAANARIDDLIDDLAEAVIGTWDPPVEILDNTFTAQRHISTLGGGAGVGARAFDLLGGGLYSADEDHVVLTAGDGSEGPGLHVYRNGLRWGSPIRADDPDALFEVGTDNPANPKVVLNNLRMWQLGDPVEIVMVGGGGELGRDNWEQFPSTSIGTAIGFYAWHNLGKHSDDELSILVEYDTVTPMLVTGGPATFDVTIWQHPAETVPVFTDGRRLHLKWGATPPVTGSELRVKLGDGTIVGTKSIRRDSGSSTLTGHINAFAETTVVFEEASDTVKLAVDNGSDAGGDGVNKSAANKNPYFDRGAQIGARMMRVADGISQAQVLIFGAGRMDVPRVGEDLWISPTGGIVASGKTTWEDDVTPYGYRASLLAGQLTFVGSDLTDPPQYDPVKAVSPGYTNPLETNAWANFCITMSDKGFWPGFSLRDALAPDRGVDFVLDRAGGLVELARVKRGTSAKVITSVTKAPSGLTRLGFGVDHNIPHESLAFITGLEFKDVVDFHEDRVMTLLYVDPRHVDVMGTRHDDTFTYSTGGEVFAEARAASMSVNLDTGVVNFPLGLGAVAATTIAGTTGIFSNKVKGTAFGSNSIVLADDIAGSFTTPSASGFIIVGLSGQNHYAFLRYRTDTPSLVEIAKHADVNLTTGVLADGAGTDAKLTISIHTDGKIYFSNRTGGSSTVIYTVLTL